MHIISSFGDTSKTEFNKFGKFGFYFFSDLKKSDYKLELFPGIENNGVYEVTVAATNNGTSFVNVCCENPYDDTDNQLF